MTSDIGSKLITRKLSWTHGQILYAIWKALVKGKTFGITGDQILAELCRKEPKYFGDATQNDIYPRIHELVLTTDQVKEGYRLRFPRLIPPESDALAPHLAKRPHRYCLLPTGEIIRRKLTAAMVLDRCNKPSVSRHGFATYYASKKSLPPRKEQNSNIDGVEDRIESCLRMGYLKEDQLGLTCDQRTIADAPYLMSVAGHKGKLPDEFI